jgi:hypothetical protein
MAVVAHYGGVFVVPTTSPAYNEDPTLNEFQWRDGTVSDQPMRLSPTLPTDATGAHRYEMQATNPAASPPVFCRPGGGVTHSGIAVRWRPKADAGPWSEYSSYAGQYVTPAVGGVAPVVGVVAITPTTLSVGQVATVNWDVNPGNGTGFAQALELLINDVVVATQTPGAAARSAQYIPQANGTLKARLTASSSVPPASTVTSTGVTVTATPTGPSIVAIVFDKPAYTTGDVARVLTVFSAGNGTGLTGTCAFKRNGVTFATVPMTISGGEARAEAPLGVAGTLTATVTITTSVSSAQSTSGSVTISVPRPPRLDNSQWRFADVVAVTGFANRFTGRLTIDVAATAVQWTFTPSDASSWRPTTDEGTLGGKTLWQLAPAVSGGTSHLIGFGEVSPPIFVRYSTAGGTSDPSDTAKSFQAPQEPPPGGDLPALQDDDWEFAAVVDAPGLRGRYTAQISILAGGTSEIDDTDITSVEWIMPARRNEWGLAENVGIGGGGEILWQMRAVIPGGSSHTVGPEQESPDVFVRYSTAEGTSLISVLPKRFTGNEAPERPDNAPAAGTKFLSDDLRITVGGRRMISPPDGVPGTILGEISVTVATVDDVTTVTFQLPNDLAPGAEVHVVNYGGRRRRVGPTGLVTFPYVEGKPLWLAAGVNAIGRGIDRYGFVPEV